MSARHYADCEACVDEILARLGKRIVCGVPLGIGKPNALLNALYRRAKADASIQLDIVTALSLNPPLGTSELEERFLAPVRERVWPRYPRLEYLDDETARRLPPNVRVIEFYLRAASQLGNPTAQQNYISSNYTHVARDLISRGVNLLLQAVALRDIDGRPHYSLSSNPDITLELLPRMREVRWPWLSVVQVNRELPWMGHAAVVGDDDVHLVVDDPALDHAPFAVPHDAVSTADWAIGLRASRLVRDGGTLQVGIGALGDAVCHGLRLRERDNATYTAALDTLQAGDTAVPSGDSGRFARGLYVSSELISNAVYALFEDRVVRRRVHEDEATQRAALAGEDVPGGVAMQGAFFIGPGDFYRRLRELPEDRRALIDMKSVAEVNRIYTRYAIEALRRQHARFINITMKVTLLGAAVSDQLNNGQVLSGVGGQHDFVSMAHQLPDARSILLLRATHGSGRTLASNIVWEFPHATVPRHERDIVVTEYGIADLRGRTDGECCAALIAIADSRFQRALVQAAQAAGKLPPGWQVPDHARNNVPLRIETALAPHRASGALPVLPFGSDLTDAELKLMGRLKALQGASATWRGRARLLRALLAPADAQQPAVAAALSHLKLDTPRRGRERLLARLVRAAFRL